MNPEEAASQAATQGSAAAKDVIQKCVNTPLPFAALSAAASSLLSASFAMLERSQNQKTADDWMTVVLATAKEALGHCGIDVTFSFARKQP